MSKVLQSFAIDLVAASIYLAFGSLLTLVVRYGLGISTLSRDLDQLDDLLSALLGDHDEDHARDNPIRSETRPYVHFVIPDIPEDAS